MEVESRSRMAKIMELQRRLRLQRAFKKISAPPPPPPEPSNYVEDDDVEYTDVEMLDEVEDPEDENTPAQLIDDSFYEAGFDRYDIVELNGDGTAGEAFSESVIIKHSNEMSNALQHALEPEIKIKSEPEDVYEPPSNIFPRDLNLIPSNLFKQEPNDDYAKAHPTLAEFQDAELIRIKQELLKSCEGDLLIPKVLEKKKLTWRYPNTEKNRDGVLECDICGKRFTYLRSFKQHRSDHKLQNDCIECRVCGKMLKPSAMDYHMNYKHSEERKFQVIFL